MSLRSENSTPSFSDELEEYALGGIYEQTSLNYGEDLEDVEDQQLHDQLPTVDEVKANLGTRTSRLGTKNCKAITFFFVFTVLILCTVIGVAVPESNRAKKAQAEQTDLTEEVIQFLLKYKVSLEPNLRYNGSPHRRAAQFLAYGDAYRMPMTSENAGRFIDRYSLAVLYYALGGHDWTYALNFMSPRDTCAWYSLFTTTKGSTIREGVDCDSNGRVTQILLGKARGE